MAVSLPQFVVMKSVSSGNVGNVYCQRDGSVVFGQKNVFDTTVKMEAERSKINNSYYSFRFFYSNKYLQKNANDDKVVAQSNQPDEDTSKASCTLFEVVKADNNGGCYLRHVQSRGVVRMNPSSLAFYVDRENTSSNFYLVGFINWDELVKFPTNSAVAFKGVNGNYLKAYGHNHLQMLQFGSSDKNDGLCGNTVRLFDNGTIGLCNLLWNQYWRLGSDSWILADSKTVGNANETLFTPYKLNDNTIALRSVANNMYCKVLTTSSAEGCLNARDSDITRYSQMQVEELVSQRKIFNVIYRMEDSRIFDEKPYIAGTAVLTNQGDEEATLSQTITYQNEVSYTFSNSLSITTGVSTSIQAGVPGIADASIDISFEINTTMEWGNTTTTTTSTSATGTATVPARSKVTLSYVGTKGTCSVPFSYTQQDKSSKDGSVTQTDQVDGIYTGVNCYNFNFIIGPPQRL